VLSALALAACQHNEVYQDDWRVPDAEQERVNPIRYDVDSVNEGKLLFTRYCQSCHGYHGEGDGVVGARLGEQPANLLRLAGRQSEGAFAWKIQQGRGAMPAFHEKLTNREIWTIVNFVVSLENEEATP